MADNDTLRAEIEALEKETQELNGLTLATGVILTQLLQRICARELNPQQAAGKIMETAREGIQSFAEQTNAGDVMKGRALAAVEQYEEQIRSALRD